MTLPKQRKGESDADYAARLAVSKEGNRKAWRKYREKNREARREAWRKYREKNGEALRGARREYFRKYSQANKEALKEASRKRREAKVLASAKGKPLRADFQRATRPKILTMLILKVAEDFCRNYGFPLERKFDADILRHAAKTIRDSPELDGAANPWYGTDFLNPEIVNNYHWAYRLRLTWRNKA